MEKIKTVLNKNEAKLALSKYLNVDIEHIQIKNKYGLLYYYNGLNKAGKKFWFLAGPTYRVYKDEKKRYYIRQVT